MRNNLLKIGIIAILSTAFVLGGCKKNDTDSELPARGYFVPYDGKVYFHMPDESAMDVAGLGSKYASWESGDTILYAADIKSGEAERVLSDHAWGEMSLCGDTLAYQNAQQPGNESIELFDFRSESSDSGNPGLYYVGGDDTGHFAAAYEYASETDRDGFRVNFYKDGDKINEVFIDGNMYFCCFYGSSFIYQNSSYDTDEPPVLCQLNAESGEVIELGKLPRLEDGFTVGEFVQCELDGDDLYATYAFYEGTGHFYSGGQFIKATLGKEGSLSCEQISDDNIDEDEENGPNAFCVSDGKLLPCDGKPGTSMVIGDDMGYVNADGEFVAVASGYGSVTTGEDGEETVDEVELSQLVGDYIYAIRNVSSRAPEEDVGWRYAYRRDMTEAFRVNINTGEKETLAVQNR